VAVASGAGGRWCPEHGAGGVQSRGTVASVSEAGPPMGMTVVASWPYCNARAAPGKSGCRLGMRGPHGNGDGRAPRTGASLAWAGRPHVTPSFKAKPNAHIICAQESSLHTYHTKNGYRITNVSISSIYYMNIVLHKIKSNAHEDTTVDRLHNSTSNRPGAIAHLELLIEESQIFFSF
jgi:hypothetical protein